MFSAMARLVGNLHYHFGFVYFYILFCFLKFFLKDCLQGEGSTHSLTFNS